MQAVHELAWVWRTTPVAVLEAPVNVFLAWWNDTERVVEKFKPTT